MISKRAWKLAKSAMSSFVISEVELTRELSNIVNVYYDYDYDYE